MESPPDPLLEERLRPARDADQSGGHAAAGRNGDRGVHRDGHESRIAAQVTANVTLPTGGSYLAAGMLGMTNMDRASPGGWTCAPAAAPGVPSTPPAQLLAHHFDTRVIYRGRFGLSERLGVSWRLSRNWSLDQLRRPPSTSPCRCLPPLSLCPMSPARPPRHPDPRLRPRR